jgi:ribonuclease P protein component
LDHRLKSTKQIEQLFRTGKSVFIFPIKLVWLDHSDSDGIAFRYGVSVSKRNFKKAVDRNRIKRQLRESCRSAMTDFEAGAGIRTDMMFIYVADKMLDFKIIDRVIHRLIRKIKHIK